MTKKQAVKAAAAAAETKVQETEWRSHENGEFPEDSKDIIADVEGVGEVPARYMNYLFYSRNANGVWQMIENHINRWKYADTDK